MGNGEINFSPFIRTRKLELENRLLKRWNNGGEEWRNFFLMLILLQFEYFYIENPMFLF